MKTLADVNRANQAFWNRGTQDAQKHEPAGSSKGGQFTSGGGSAGGKAPDPKRAKPGKGGSKPNFGHVSSMGKNAEKVKPFNSRADAEAEAEAVRLGGQHGKEYQFTVSQGYAPDDPRKPEYHVNVKVEGKNRGMLFK
jgi:hypothetical protein